MAAKISISDLFEKLSCVESKLVDSKAVDKQLHFLEDVLHAVDEKLQVIENQRLRQLEETMDKKLQVIENQSKAIDNQLQTSLEKLHLVETRVNERAPDEQWKTYLETENKALLTQIQGCFGPEKDASKKSLDLINQILADQKREIEDLRKHVLNIESQQKLLQNESWAVVDAQNQKTPSGRGGRVKRKTAAGDS